MSTPAQALAERLDAFNNQLIQFVKSVPEAKWRQHCKGEEWSVGVVARHIGAGHYGSIELAKMMIAGSPMPEFSEAQLSEMANSHAEKHADCTREEVLSILESKGRKLVDYVAGLSDDDLSSSAHIAGFGGEVTVKQLIVAINLKSAGEHLESMRNALAQA